jgi:hypothetical protein
MLIFILRKESDPFSSTSGGILVLFHSDFKTRSEN